MGRAGRGGSTLSTVKNPKLVCGTTLVVTAIASATTLLAVDRLGQGMGLLLFCVGCIGLVIGGQGLLH